MAIAVPAVGIEITAKLDKLREEMAKIGPLGGKEAKALAAQFSREIKAMEKATKGAVERTGADVAKMLDKIAAANAKAASQATGFSAFSDDAKRAKFDVGALGSNTAKLAGAMDMLGPSAGGATRAVADLADVGEVGTVVVGALGGVSGALAVGLVALAGAVAPVAGQLYVMHREAAEADARTQFLAEHADDLSSALDGLETALTDAAIATGRLSEEQGEYVKNQDAATRALAEFRKSQEPARQAAEEQADAAETMLTKLEVLPDFLATAIDYYGGYTSAQKEAIWTLTELDKKEDEHQIIVSETKTATDEATAASLRDAGSKKVQAGAVRMAAAAYEALESAAASESARIGRVQGGIATLAAMTAESAAAQLDDEGKLQAAYDDRLRKIGEIQASAILASRTEHEQVVAVAAGKQAAAEAEKAHLYEIDQLRAKNADKEVERQKKAADEAQRMREREIASYDQSASQIADASAQLADVMGENHREAAMTFYAVSKAAALTQVAISTAVAIGKANELGPPASYIAMAAAGAVGAAQVATIAATPPPSFHTGTSMVGQDPRVGEINARLKAKEAVVSEQGVDQLGGRGVIDAANSGRLRGSGGGGTAIMFGHRAIHATMREAVRTPGPLSRAMNKGRIVGHRGRS